MISRRLRWYDNGSVYYGVSEYYNLGVYIRSHHDCETYYQFVHNVSKSREFLIEFEIVDTMKWFSPSLIKDEMKSVNVFFLVRNKQYTSLLARMGDKIIDYFGHEFIAEDIKPEVEVCLVSMPTVSQRFMFGGMRHDRGDFVWKEDV